MQCLEITSATWRTAAALSMIALCTCPVRAQCPSPTASPEIEVLPVTVPLKGNTCDLPTNFVNNYPGCAISGNTYSNPEAIYKVWLHEGNNVKFTLIVRGGDLALVLRKACPPNPNPKLDTCVKSADGAGNEIFPEKNYASGFYYLYIDAAEPGRGCGPYELLVTGTNPVPDLVVNLSSSSKTVVAGRPLTYTLTVENRGSPDATNVKVTQMLPVEASIQGVSSSPPIGVCSTSGRPGKPKKVLCEIPRLSKGSRFTGTIRVLVDPATRGTLSSTADAKADEGDPTPSNNERIKDDTTVIARSTLSIEKLPSRAVAVAGEPFIYTLRVSNAGPSEAKGVKVTDTLPAGVKFVPQRGCDEREGTVTCDFPPIPPSASKERKIKVNVNESVDHDKEVTNTASVKETENGPASLSAKAITRVVRKADLGVTKSGSKEVVAGDTGNYTITLCNCGPSASSGAKITDELPPGLTFFGPDDDCSSDSTGKVVTCLIEGDIAPTACKNGKCTAGSASASFMVHVDPSLESETRISNTASVEPKRAEQSDENQGNNRSDMITTVQVEADLELQKTALRVSDLAEAKSVVAGENLTYSIVVTNRGPSNSPGGTIQDKLTGLTYVASPDEGCLKEPTQPVTCQVPILREGESVTRRFVVKIDSSATGTIANKACVNSKHDTNGRNDCDETTTDLERKADLAVDLSDSLDPMEASDPPVLHNLRYKLTVNNSGPSDADSFAVRLTLPSGALFREASDASCKEEAGTEPSVVRCDFVNGLPAGKTEFRQVDVEIPGTRGTIVATASIAPVECPPTDPQCENNKEVETTTFVKTDDADLSLAKTAGVDTVVAGDLLRYRLEVTNHGPAQAVSVTVEDRLPGTLEFDLDESEGCTGNGQLVTCNFDDIPNPVPDLPDRNKSVRVLTAKVKASSTNYLLHNTASIPARASDPNPFNQEAAADTLVLGDSLVLPFFRVDSTTKATTLLAVKNPSETSTVGVRYGYFLGEGQEPGTCQTCCLQPKQTHTQDLLTLSPEGRVGITPVDDCVVPCPATSQTTCDGDQPPSLPASPPVPPLSGDFVRIDAAAGPAAAFPLVATGTSRVLPELCRRWSVRFVSSGPLKASTEIFFFVPGNHSNGKPAAVGKVYDEAGQFFQEISVTDSREGFRRVTEAEVTSTDSLRLLPSFGTIEWEFPNGVGYVSAIHRFETTTREYAVAVPGFCRRPPSDEDLGSESSLIVPYFETDSAGANTLFAVHNESDSTVKIRYEYFSANGTLLHEEAPPDTPPLAAHATRTVNLRDIAALRGQTGYIRVELDEQPTARKAQILSGDFVRIDPKQSLASGGALVDSDQKRSPRQLCRRWNVRFLQGAPPDSTTDFVFYAPHANSAGNLVATGVVYSEAGGESLGTANVPVGLSSLAYQISAKDLELTPSSLKLPGSGSIEWDFGQDSTGKDLFGNVDSILRTNGWSALVPGTCVPDE